ncbi:MAG: low affinity iron permease family protein [Acidimicrobiales bacterium]
MSERKAPLEPTDVSSRVGFFDRFAGGAAHLASRAPFFAFCIGLVVAWLTQGVLTIVLKGSASAFLDDKYQLEINTTTTIITFLLVALLQNSQTRNDQATQHKLNAIAEGLAALMTTVGSTHPDAATDHDVRELRASVGLEDRESTSDNSDAANAPGDSSHSSD